MTTVAVPDLLGTSPADLIDRWAEQPVATRDVATRRAERIRTGVASYAAMRQDIADAYAQRDWLALDYDTWHAYVQAEFGEELRKLARARDERREMVQDLRTQGMSTRQIATAVGTPKSVVADDLKVSGTRTPDTVTGADGKTYAATQTPARRDPEPTSGGPAIATTGGPDPEDVAADDTRIDTQGNARAAGAGEPRGAQPPQPPSPVADLIADDPDVQAADYMARFSAALARAGGWMQFDAERVAAQASPTTWAAIEAHAQVVAHTYERMRKARSGLRVIKGGVA